jgi:cobalt/nickel transport system permease protein
MHIPDGYLSPSTCAVLYAAAFPFWSIALRRLKRRLMTRLVPILSLFAAFSFVIMMFNLPLPGGTTGHAVGMGAASIVLGPWAAIVAISVALLIQALFFGDGGITALGANCFNMAIVGSIVAWACYRLISGHAELQSRRRVVAAAIAGYVAINASALCAAIEFGIQPLFFHDGSGAPLYAPYPLRIAIPAMMIGHLTFAGLAELVISGGIVAYLQRADPALLKLSAGSVEEERALSPTGLRTRPLWLALTVLTILTPLGLVAAGRAWGEWTAADFADTAVRGQIAAASGNMPPPINPPIGLQRLSTIWRAPLGGYAPPFMQNAWFGYLLSAMFGTGVILLVFILIRLLAGRFASGEDPHQKGAQ